MVLNAGALSGLKSAQKGLLCSFSDTVFLSGTLAGITTPAHGVVLVKTLLVCDSLKMGTSRLLYLMHQSRGVHLHVQESLKDSPGAALLLIHFAFTKHMWHLVLSTYTEVTSSTSYFSETLVMSLTCKLLWIETSAKRLNVTVLHQSNRYIHDAFFLKIKI